MDPHKLAVLSAKMHTLLAGLLPRPAMFTTVEGQMVGACLDGLVTGRNRMGQLDDAMMSSTDLTTPGALDAVQRECTRLMLHDSIASESS